MGSLCFTFFRHGAKARRFHRALFYQTKEGWYWGVGDVLSGLRCGSFWCAFFSLAFYCLFPDSGDQPFEEARRGVPSVEGEEAGY